MDQGVVQNSSTFDIEALEILSRHEILVGHLDSPIPNRIREVYLGAENYIHANEMNQGISELLFYRGLSNIVNGDDIAQIMLGLKQVEDSNKMVLFSTFVPYYDRHGFKASQGLKDLLDAAKNTIVVVLEINTEETTDLATAFSNLEVAENQKETLSSLLKNFNTLHSRLTGQS